jgi:hypothetical protein
MQAVVEAVLKMVLAIPQELVVQVAVETVATFQIAPQAQEIIIKVAAVVEGEMTQELVVEEVRVL